MKDKYCRECGCAILSDEDIGFEDVETEPYRILASAPVSGILEKPFVVCTACLEESERNWEEFKKTDEGKYECAFNRWVQQELVAM